MIDAHPAASLFPELSREHLAELARDIKEHGLLEPVEIYEGLVLDGRNRLRACELVGVKPKYVEACVDGLGPTVYVVSKNLHRRHLTASQRAAVATEMLPMLKAEARERQLTGKRPSTTNGGRSKGEAKALAGEAVAVSRNYVDAADRLQREAPETFERVKAGDLTIRAAERELGLRPTSGQHSAPTARPDVLGGKKRSTVAPRERLRRLGDALAGYLVGLDGLSLRGTDCNRELDRVAAQARAIARTAQRMKGGES